MSVEKMEEYKKYKKNRKEILRKEKRRKKINKIIGSLFCVIVLCFAGFFIYQNVKPAKETKPYQSLVKWNKYIPDSIGSQNSKEESDSDASASDKASTDSTDANATDSQQTTSEDSGK